MNPHPTLEKLAAALREGRILPSAHDACAAWLDENLFEAWVIESVAELVEEGHWAEINNRFYKTLAFGTGGIRGRTIGAVVTRAERGARHQGECPEHPAAGSNCMNDFNVRRATMGLLAYVKKAGSGGARPRLVFAHDTRHFSRHFAELAATTVGALGGEAILFESERSTPELSFAVRELGADAGVVLTASHNPPHDNGFKAYFHDGAQVVEPHASGIIREVNAISGEDICRVARMPSVAFTSIGATMDEAYITRLMSLWLETNLIAAPGRGATTVVYSALHGTGARIVPRILEKAGLRVLIVPEQIAPDGRFPTVKSPNPENAEALALGIQLAERAGADVVMATDPDADRMGVAVRNRHGKMELLTGNQIGSMLAHYRLERLFAHGVLNERNRTRARLIKTVVTTDLQKAIAAKFGVPIPETLTGFKYIGEKLQKYEEQTCAAVGLRPADYRRLDEMEKRDLHLRHGGYYVFGGEESYGYSASDFTRDKDANAACLMFAELAAFVKAQGRSLTDELDRIQSELGCHAERLGQMVYEGAEGAAKIQKILETYENHPPSEIAGRRVTGVTNHGAQDIRDVEGDLLPREALLFISLDDGSRYAVRGSGTEPKIKFYLFARKMPPKGQRFSEVELAAAKAETAAFLGDLWKAIETDARQRAES